MKTEITEVEVFECSSGCVLLVEDSPEFEPLYECGNCGTMFSRSNSMDGSSHKCPDCSKFSTRVGLACPECEEQIGDDLYKLPDSITRYRCDVCENIYDEEDSATECCPSDDELDQS